jgi:hypothetical protein
MREQTAILLACMDDAALCDHLDLLNERRKDEPGAAILRQMILAEMGARCAADYRKYNS